MVMHPHTKYHWPISKDKNVMVRTRKYYLKQLFDLEVKCKGPMKVITVRDTSPYGHAPTWAGVLLKAGTAYPSRAHGFTPVFGGIRVTIFLLFCVVLCLSLSSVLFAQCYQFLWIVHSFLIAPSVFSNVYLTQSWVGNIVRVAVFPCEVVPMSLSF
jgi:hypothetical protein